MQFEVISFSPFSERFVEMQDTQIGKVRHARNGFQSIKASKGTVPSFSGIEDIKKEGFEGAHHGLVSFFGGFV